MNCEICSNHYDRSKREPYVVSPCSHTFCIDCLLKLNLKECRTCGSEIKAKNTNWALLQLIPESSYDQLKSKVQHTYSQVENSKNSYSDLRLVNLDANLKNLESFKTDIEIKHNRLKELINTHFEQLKHETIAIEEKVRHDRMVIVEKEVEFETKLEKIKSDLDSNKLDESELSRMNDELMVMNSNVCKLISEKDKWHEYVFVGNDHILLVENLIGKIKNKNE